MQSRSCTVATLMTTPSDEPANRSRVFVALGILGVVIAAILGLVLLAGKLIFDGVGGSDESLTASRMQQEREASELWRRPEEWLEEARDQVGILRMRRTRRAKNALPHQDPWVDEFKTLGPLPPDMIALGETSFRKSREAKLVWLENFRSSSDLETLEDLLREAELQAECELPLAALEALARGGLLHRGVHRDRTARETRAWYRGPDLQLLLEL